MPAALAAARPAGLSSITTQAAGSAPMREAAKKKRSGAGLPRATMVALKTLGSKSGSNPVRVSERRMRSGWLDEATQTGPPMAPTASAMPGIGLSSASKRSKSRARIPASMPSVSSKPRSRRSQSATEAMERPRSAR
nr:hypothetical protein [Mangrovicoccus ximenensis]